MTILMAFPRQVTYEGNWLHVLFRRLSTMYHDLCTVDIQPVQTVQVLSRRVGARCRLSGAGLGNQGRACRRLCSRRTATDRHASNRAMPCPIAVCRMAGDHRLEARLSSRTVSIWVSRTEVVASVGSWR